MISFQTFCFFDYICFEWQTSRHSKFRILQIGPNVVEQSSLKTLEIYSCTLNSVIQYTAQFLFPDWLLLNILVHTTLKWLKVRVVSIMEQNIKIQLSPKCSPMFENDWPNTFFWQKSVDRKTERSEINSIDQKFFNEWKRFDKIFFSNESFIIQPTFFHFADLEFNLSLGRNVFNLKKIKLKLFWSASVRTARAFSHKKIWFLSIE